MGTLNIDAHTGLPVPVADAIKRYRRSYRKRLRRFARLSAAHSDVIQTCPVVAFALVTDYGTVEMRAAAVEALKRGAPVKTVLAALDLPAWLRKLPSQALTVSLAQIWWSEQANVKLAGMIPTDVAAASGWFRYVVKANQVGGEQFSVWLSGQNVRWAEARLYKARDLRTLAAFAWFSLHRELPAGLLIERPWHPKIGFVKAIDAADQWLDTITSQVLLDREEKCDAWLTGGRINGYRFVSLLTQAELDEEAKALNHCVDTYAEPIADGTCRLFGIRQGRRHVATLEIRPHPTHVGRPMVVQLRGRENEEVTDAIWKAVFQWLAKQKEFRLPDPYASEKTVAGCKSLGADFPPLLAGARAGRHPAGRARPAYAEHYAQRFAGFAGAGLRWRLCVDPGGGFAAFAGDVPWPSVGESDIRNASRRARVQIWEPENQIGIISFLVRSRTSLPRPNGLPPATLSWLPAPDTLSDPWALDDSHIRPIALLSAIHSRDGGTQRTWGRRCLKKLKNSIEYHREHAVMRLAILTISALAFGLGAISDAEAGGKKKNKGVAAGARQKGQGAARTCKERRTATWDCKEICSGRPDCRRLLPDRRGALPPPPTIRFARGQGMGPRRPRPLIS